MWIIAQNAGFPGGERTNTIPDEEGYRQDGLWIVSLTGGIGGGYNLFALLAGI